MFIWVLYELLKLIWVCYNPLYLHPKGSCYNSESCVYNIESNNVLTLSFPGKSKYVWSSAKVEDLDQIV